MRNLYFKIFMWFWLAMALVGTAFVISTVTLQNSAAEERQREFVTTALALMAEDAIERYESADPARLQTHLDRINRGSRLQALLFDAGSRMLSDGEVPGGGMALVGRALASGELVAEDLDEDHRMFALAVEGARGADYAILATMEWPFRGGRRGGGDRFDGSRGRRGETRSESAAGEAAQPTIDPAVPDAAESGPAVDDRDESPGGDRGGFRGGRGPNIDTRPPWYVAWASVVDQPAALAIRLLAVFLTAGILCFGLARYLTAPVLRLRDATHQLAGGDLSVRVGPEVANRGDEIAELGRDFDIMAERVEALLTSQRQLLSDVSHELRSPLARLNVALGLARQRAGEEAAGPLDRIETEADQLNALIGRVLALSRFESGAVEPEFSRVDFSRLVSDVAADADFEAKAKDVAVVCHAADGCRLEGNEPLLRSAIENVVRNAVRYTAAGTEVVVRLSADEAGDGMVVSVRDHGPGVPEDQLDQLFEPFYRIADSRDRETGGTGLGLSIADRAVRLHGGTMTARNAEDGGLVVDIGLPIFPAESSES